MHLLLCYLTFESVLSGKAMTLKSDGRVVAFAAGVRAGGGQRPRPVRHDGDLAGQHRLLRRHGDAAVARGEHTGADRVAPQETGTFRKPFTFVHYVSTYHRVGE